MIKRFHNQKKQPNIKANNSLLIQANQKALNGSRIINNNNTNTVNTSTSNNNINTTTNNNNNNTIYNNYYNSNLNIKA
jgi:hypothetical protein